MVEFLRICFFTAVLTAGATAPPGLPAAPTQRPAPGDTAQVAAVRTQLTEMLVTLYDRLEPFEQLLQEHPEYDGIPSFRRIAQDLPKLQTLLMQDAKRIRNAKTLGALRDAQRALTASVTTVTQDVETWITLLVLDIEQLEEDDEESAPPEPVPSKLILRT